MEKTKNNMNNWILFSDKIPPKAGMYNIRL